MKALVFKGSRNIVYDSFPDPILEAASDILIAVKACSICGSDLHIYHGDRIGPHDYSKAMPAFCVGHETIGEVLEVGAAVKQHRVGDRVMVSPGVGCGQCPPCLRGQIAHCHQPRMAGAFGTHRGLNGGQADYFRVPHADLIARTIPDGVSNDQALLLTDALSTAYFGVKGAQLAPGEIAVVIGLGPVGLMAVESCCALGAERVYGIDPVAHRRDLAQALGAISLSPDEAMPIIKQQTQGLGADCVIEAVGLEATISQAFKLVRVGGRVSVLGIAQQGAVLPMAYVQMKNISLFTGVASVVNTWSELIPLLQQGRIKAGNMFSHRYSLADGAQAYAKFDARGDDTLKMMMIP